MFKNTDASSIKHFTRGGQTFLHNFRMFSQIFGRALLAVIIIFIIINCIVLLLKTTPYQRYVTWEWLNANIVDFFNETAKQTFIEPSDHSITIFTHQLLITPVIQQLIDKVWLTFLYSSMASLGLSLFIFWGISVWLQKRGEEQTQDKLIKGDTLVECEQLARAIKKAIIYDKSGDYTRYFYRNDYDVQTQSIR